MKVEWMNHTGFVVRDMERSLAFYKDVLGLEEERNEVLEGELIDQLTGFPDAKLHIVYLGNGDRRHSIELVEYLNPPSERTSRRELNAPGATHLGFIVDDVDAFYRELPAKGAKFVSAPFVRTDAIYPRARKACYVQDPEGNWLEFIEFPPEPPRATGA